MDVEAVKALAARNVEEAARRDVEAAELRITARVLASIGKQVPDAMHARAGAVPAPSLYDRIRRASTRAAETGTPVGGAELDAIVAEVHTVMHESAEHAGDDLTRILEETLRRLAMTEARAATLRDQAAALTAIIDAPPPARVA